MLRTTPFIVLLLCACDEKKTGTAIADASAAPNAAPSAKLTSIGPRLLSNQTSSPLTVRGEGLKSGMKLKLDVPDVTLALEVLDDTHAWARLPSTSLPADQLQVIARASLEGGNEKLPLKIVNDTAFPVLTSLAVSGQTAFVASITEDVVYAVDLGTKAVKRIAVSDGPDALAVWQGQVVVAHRFAPELVLIAQDGSTKKLPAPNHAVALAVDHDTLYLAEHARDTVSALNLADEAKELWRAPVAPNPGVLAVTPAGLAVGSHQTGEVEWLDLATGKALHSVSPGPGAGLAGPSTRGGVTPALSKYVMNGSMQRALAWSTKGSRLFAASIGPVIGPNPGKVEVSMNGGVAVIDVGGKDKGTPSYLRHLGFGAGVTQALALDDARGLLYAADIGLGLVRVVDTKKLGSKSAADAEKAVLQEVAIAPPADFPLVRGAEDFAVKNRAGLALHSGPSALSLSADGKTLYVLNRFTGMLARLDVKAADKKGASVIDELPITPMLGFPSRRRGEVLYYTDLGRSAVTCDSCHPDGHTAGIFFEKTKPMRIYRSTTVRGSLETPPYFTPASTFSMGQTAQHVMPRNRFGNPAPTPQELEEVTVYSSMIPTLPNPFVGESGAPPRELTLPDGHVSHPLKGLALFEGKAGCAGCHPGPHFTTDQDPSTRGPFIDVGTPHVFPLREELQDPTFVGFGTPALVGSWDVWPMFTTGVAGYVAQSDGAVTVGTRFPLRMAVKDWAPKHGRADLLSDEELDDLLGYVQSL